jgi:hypothetical protein
MTKSGMAYLLLRMVPKNVGYRKALGQIRGPFSAISLHISHRKSEHCMRRVEFYVEKCDNLLVRSKDDRATLIGSEESPDSIEQDGC